MTESDATPGRHSPLDDPPWPEKLTARVVRPGHQPAIHGYDVEGDLAQHYSFAETVLLALTGELPSEKLGRAFEIALQFSAPVTVNEAPTHAAVLARICAGTTSSIQGTAAIALAEQARVVVQQHGPWFEALSTGVAALPDCSRPSCDDERTSVERLRRALRDTVEIPGLAHDVSRTAAIIAVFHACGLKTPRHVECALVIGRLATTVAEALAAPPRSFHKYPTLLPQIVYEEGAT